MPVELTEAENNHPFAGILGNTTELKVLEYLLSLPSFTFNISELGRAAIVSRPIAQKVIEVFTKWGILKVVSQHSGVNLYQLNEDSAHVQAMQRFVFATNDLVFDLAGHLSGQVSVEEQASFTSVLDLNLPEADESRSIFVEFDPSDAPLVLAGLAEDPPH